MEGLRFIYRKANGEESTRTVTHWREEGNHFIGLCSSDNSIKSFLKPRVVQWLDGTEPAFDLPTQPLPEIKKPAQQHTVCFTCFAEADKPAFRRMAEQAGLKVVTDVRKHLTFLCIGNYGNAARAFRKRTLARLEGAYIIPADAFANLLETGELPDYESE